MQNTTDPVCGAGEGGVSTLLMGMFIGYIVLMVVLTIVAIYFKSAQTEESGGDEVKGHYGGQYHPVIVALTMFASIFSGITITGVPETAAKSGFIAMNYLSLSMFAFFGLLVLAPRYRRIGQARGYTSPYDIIADRYRSPMITSLITFYTFLAVLVYLALQFVAFGETLSGALLGAISKQQASVLGVVIIMIMEFLGGMHVVVLSDVLQGVIMVVGFIMMLFVMASNYGSVMSLSSAECVQGTAIMTNMTTGEPYTVDYGCLHPYGGTFAVRPPVHIIHKGWTCIAYMGLATILTPHALQRIPLAKKDSDIKKVMMFMLWTPFIALVPAVAVGLTVAAYKPLWLAKYACEFSSQQQFAAFSVMTTHLSKQGGIQAFLVALLICAALAAIMSSADSAVLGLSNVLSIDIFQAMWFPNASRNSVVTFGFVMSCLVCLLSVRMGWNMSAADITPMFFIGQGLLLQCFPAFIFSLFMNVKRQAIIAGLFFGLLSLVYSLGAQADPSNDLFRVMFFLVVPVLINIIVCAVWQLCLPGDYGEGAGCCLRETQNSYRYNLRKRLGPKLTLSKINEIMEGTMEPNRFFFAISIILGNFTCPWWTHVFETSPLEQLWGFPKYVALTLIMLLACAVSSTITILSWRTVDELEEEEEELDSGKSALAMPEERTTELAEI